MENQLGALIKKRREKLGYSQVKLAKLCDVTHGTLSRWERGLTKDIKRAQICLLSQYLYIPIDTLLGLSNVVSTEDLDVVRLKSSITSSIDSINDKSKLEQIKKVIDALM